jgi:putative transposase
VRRELGVSERRACRTLGQHRSTQRNVPQGRADEERLTDDIIELADKYGRYGYRMVAGLLNNAGWQVNHKRVERIWRREGLKVPQKQRKKGRLWLNDGSCVRLRPERPNHVWSYDFVQDRTHDGRVYRTLNIIDEYTREALMIRVDRKLNSTDVLDALTDLFILRGSRRNTSDPTMGRSSSPRRYGTGLRGGRRQDGLHRAKAHPGRTDTAKASTPGSATSC